ncbi:MAG: glycosyltransferase [Bacteroidetes bacterium]|nr:glycosyltransferase [Bacteroidota bacterium]
MISKPNVRICLNMIVRNEAAVIRRCLESVMPYISSWVIVDTGSTDDTKEIIRECLKDLNGELHERPWKNFGHNRSEALELAKGKGDYILIIDADEVLVFNRGFQWPAFDKDGYFIETKLGITSYPRMQLVDNRLHWKFISVLHEYIYSSEMKSTETLLNVYNHPHTDGARSNDPNKYKRDALVLENALLDEPGNSRYVFYLAQSYRDAGEMDLALKNYEKRVTLGGWPEEVWFSLYQIGLMSMERGEEWEITKDKLLKAYEYRPSRAEPLYRIAMYYRNKERYDLTFLYAEKGAQIPIPAKDILFIEKNVYEYLLPMELAISAHWIGRHDLALAANNKILAARQAPVPAIFEQTIINRNYTLDKTIKRKPFSGKKNKIKVAVLFYNCGGYLDNCISSLLKQDYDNFEMIFIDDASTDGSHERIPTDDPRITLIRNTENKGGAWNLHQSLLRCQPDDIFFQLDGDDWLSCNDALSHVNRFYEETSCWVMYGQFMLADGTYGLSRPFTDSSDFRNMRHDWISPVPRTFRAGLYHRIADQDPAYDCMRDTKGEWYREAMDVAMIYPVLELAGFENVKFNTRTLYVYNNENPLNVHKTKRDKEGRNHLEIGAKRPFARIADYRFS